MCSYRALIEDHDTSTLLIQYYALKYHSHYSLLLKHNPAHDRGYLKTPHTSHLTPVTSHSEPETQPQSTISLSIVHFPSVHWTGWKENVLRTDGCYLALWLADTHQLTRLAVLMKTYWPSPVWSLSLPPDTHYHNEHITTKNCSAINIWSSTLSKDTNCCDKNSFIVLLILQTE